MELQNQVTLGTRFRIPPGHLGTIKYVGHVTGTHGLWYGVEWDDPTRGRHDGVREGKRYFDCRVPNAGSFIRQSTSLCFGHSFLEALTSKYVEAEHGSATLEKVILGSSNGVIEVEAVGLDKIRRNLGALERLREVSLVNELLATGDPAGKIFDTCPNIRGLDLSANLLSTWHTISSITSELPRLGRLTLNQNRFLPLEGKLPTSAFLCLCELQLNGTLITWEEFRRVASFMPSLRSVELGYNRIKSLTAQSSWTIPLLSLNLDGNLLDNWTQMSTSLSECTTLQHLILSSNGFRTIPPLNSAPSPLQGIKNLALSRNELREWRDIDTLCKWCPNLESLRMGSTPLTEDTDLARHAKQFIVAKIPSLLVLDSTAISARERNDCELFYLSSISKNVSGGDNEKTQEHPQWVTLCSKHGRPTELSGQNENEDKLRKSLIAIVVQRCAMIPSTQLESGDTAGPPITLKVLSTMKMGVFRSKLIKSLKIHRCRNREAVQVWLRMHDGYVSLDNDEHNLEWYGIEDGSHVLVYIQEQ
ncbi:RNI-like protein [Gyrodon lividus]|nr:RNI-like protein [Gyrodon lividus]